MLRGRVGGVMLRECCRGMLSFVCTRWCWRIPAQLCVRKECLGGLYAVYE